MNTNDLEILYNKHKKDFEHALNIYENEYSHADLIEFIKNGSIAEKQAAVLKLDFINSQSDADLLMDNLTGCDGKIREAVSFRLPEFAAKNPKLFIKYWQIFLEAVIDINGNICRNTISALKYIKNYSEFTQKFCKELLIRTYTLATKAKDFDIQDGKYKINKEIFKLYWYLETIYEFAETFDYKELSSLLVQTKGVTDYTIREKTAKILSKFDDNQFESIRRNLKNDENYYVRRF